VDIRVAIDRESGEHETFRRWKSGAGRSRPAGNPTRKSCCLKRRKRSPDAQIDEYIEQPIPSIEFGRIGAQAAKQVILQKVRGR